VGGVIFLVVDDKLQTCRRQVTGKLVTSRTSPRESYGEVAKKSCRDSIV